jgi:2-phospho-L-lactate/phosphoenolpyruvate guanylyltransferase
MRTAAILPVKSFAGAKQRLGESVADSLRLELARAMVTDVLLALEATRSIERTIVVTREQSVARSARELRALVIDEHAEAGQSAAAGLGVTRALAEGFQRVLCVRGDCPALDPAELDALLAADADADPDADLEGSAPASGARNLQRRGLGARGGAARVVPTVTIVPDRHGTGTNGLLLAPPDAIAPSFGPDSCERHSALARAAGIEPRLQRLPSLLLDVDTGADLAALRDRLSGHSARASCTRAVLGQPERTEVINITTTA